MTYNIYYIDPVGIGSLTKSCHYYCILLCSLFTLKKQKLPNEAQIMTGHDTDLVFVQSDR